MLLSFVASSRVRGQLLFHNRTIRSWSRLPLIRLSISFDTHRAHNTLPCRLFAAFKALIMHASGYLCAARTSTDFYFCHTLITPRLEDDQTKDLWVFVKRGVARDPLLSLNFPREFYSPKFPRFFSKILWIKSIYIIIFRLWGNF